MNGMLSTQPESETQVDFEIKEYVICYVPIMQKMDLGVRSCIVLIEKINPEWQRGMLNLPGGKMEPNETPEECAVRKLLEETGLVSYKQEMMGQLSGARYRVYCVLCLVPHNPEPEPKTMEKEIVHCLWLSNALHHPMLIPNLRLVIPLCRTGVKNWDIQDHDAHIHINGGPYKVSFA